MSTGSLFNTYKSRGVFPTPADTIYTKWDWLRRDQEAQVKSHHGDVPNILKCADEIIKKLTSEKSPKMHGKVISDETLAEELSLLSGCMHFIAVVSPKDYRGELNARAKSLDAFSKQFALRESTSSVKAQDKYVQAVQYQIASSPLLEKKTR